MGRNPTDRGKHGAKRSILTDGAGVPIGLAVAGANRHDSKLVAETIQSIPVARPVVTPERPQGLCLDRGYDYAAVRALLVTFAFTAHIRTRPEEATAIKQEAGYKARRWVVERTHSWMNRFRALLVRWEKQAANYLASLHLACACITFKRAGLLG